MSSSQLAVRRAAMCLMALIVGTSPVWAQGSLKDAGVKAAAAPPSEALGTLAGVGSQNGIGFQPLLEASTDEKTVMARLGWNRGLEVYAVTFKGPLDTKTKEGVPVNLEGLAGGSSVEFTVNRFNWKGPDDDDQAEYGLICAELRKTDKSCDYQDMEAGPVRRRVGQLLHLTDTPWFVSGSGGASVKKYKFRQADLKEDAETTTDWSLTGRVGVFRPRLGFVIGSVAYQQSSSAGADAVSLCQPLDGTTASTCSDVVLKPPTHTISTLVSAQVRRGLAGNVAMSPMVQYDVKKNVTAVIAPFYFLQDSKKNLIGGVRGSWRSDTKAVIISVFVGGAFALLPTQ